jgi:hypothetical protein
MNIHINDKPANITLDMEKTLGEVLSGLEHWISSSGNRIRLISVDGEVLDEDTLPSWFDRDIKKIEKLDIEVSAYKDLAAEALCVLLLTCRDYGDATFEQRTKITEDWKQSASADFLRSDVSGMYDLACAAFLGEGLTVQDLPVIIEERLREITVPAQEIAACEAVVKAVAARMEELPLDMQTGKDQKAAETIQRFSGTAQKLFRIFFILESEGLALDTESAGFTVDDLAVKDFMREFTASLTEITAAYESKDTVLVGDLSEYELAPRLLNFFFALKNFLEASSSI